MPLFLFICFRAVDNTTDILWKFKSLTFPCKRRYERCKLTKSEFYWIIINWGCRHFTFREHTRHNREVSWLSTWQNFISCFMKYGHKRLVSLYLVSMERPMACLLYHYGFNTFRAELFEVITFRPQHWSYAPHVARNVLKLESRWR